MLGGGDTSIFGDGIPSDILDQMNSLTAGMVGDIATIGAASAGTLLGLSESSKAGIGGVHDKTDQIGDLFS